MAASNRNLRPKWTFSSLGCPELALGQVVDLAARYRMDGLEIRALENRMDLPQLWEEQFGTPERLRAYLNGHDMPALSVDSSFRISSGKESDRWGLFEFAKWADGIGAPYIRVFDGGTFETTVSNEYLDAAAASVAWWREQRARNGWQTDIMVETHDALCSGAHCRTFWDACDGPVPILWDTHHTWRKGGESASATWDAIRGQVPHIHYKDSTDEPRDRLPYTYTVPGTGRFQFAELAAALAGDGYDGVLSLEWEKKWHDYLDPLEDALEAMQASRFRERFLSL